MGKADLIRLTDQIRAAFPADSGLDARLTFDFGAAGRLSVDGRNVPNVVSNDEQDADCVVFIELEDFRRTVEEGLDPGDAFRQGLMRVRGDLGVASKFAAILAQSASSGETSA